MKINWLVRVKNKAFWVALIPAVLLLVQAVAALIGVSIDLGEIGDKLLQVVNAIFTVLASRCGARRCARWRSTSARGRRASSRGCRT